MKKKFPLVVKFCKKCKLIQAPHNIKPNKIFIKYDYLSGISKMWINHCKNFYDTVIKKFRFSPKKDQIIEIASNDGTLLNFFKKKNLIASVLNHQNMLQTYLEIKK